MGAGSGLAGSIGIGVETTYGVYAPPTRWYPWEEEKFSVDRKFSKSKAIVSGSLVAQSAQTVLLTQIVKGSLKIPILTSGMGMILQAALGNVVGPTQQSTTAAYQTVATIGATVGKSLTIQIGRPEVGGVVVPYTYTGCKITSMEVTAEAGDVGECALEFIGQQMTESQTLVAPVFPSVNPIEFSFQGMTLKAGAFGAETAMGTVKKLTLKLARKLDEERFYIGGSGLVAEPIENELIDLTSDLTVDFSNTTDWDTYVNTAEKISVIVSMVGQQIASPYDYTFECQMPTAQVEGNDPAMSGPKIVEREVKLTGLDDNTHNPLTVTYISTDTTL